jgi:hypothetical protein
LASARKAAASSARPVDPVSDRLLVHIEALSDLGDGQVLIIHAN